MSQLPSISPGSTVRTFGCHLDWISVPRLKGVELPEGRIAVIQISCKYLSIHRSGFKKASHSQIPPLVRQVLTSQLNGWKDPSHQYIHSKRHHIASWNSKLGKGGDTDTATNICHVQLDDTQQQVCLVFFGFFVKPMNYGSFKCSNQFKFEISLQIVIIIYKEGQERGTTLSSTAICKTHCKLSLFKDQFQAVELGILSKFMKLWT